jgi:phosphoglycolate phosphatase
LKELLYQAREAGFKQAILTTNLEENVKAFLVNNDIDIFDYLYCGSSPFGKDKFLKRLIKEAGFAAGEAVYVGDEARDIEAAKKAGMDIICVDWGYNTRHILEQNHPTAAVSKPEDILKILQAG